MSALVAIVAILVAAALNRARGDARWRPAWLKGRALYYVSPVVGLVAYALGASTWLAAGVAVWYFVWGTPPWGYLQLLGRKVDGKEPEPSEAFLLRIARGNVHVALALRHMLAGPIAPLICLGYEVGWRVYPRGPILVGELIAGALWGAMLATIF